MMRLLLVVACAVAPVFAGVVSHSARFDARDVSLSRVGDWTVVELGGGVAAVDPGLPRLPRVVQSVLIPAGAEPVGVSVTGVEWEALEGSYLVHPSQPDAVLPMPGRSHEPALVGPDPVAYSSAAPYPGRVARVVGAQTLGGFRLAAVELCPVRWTAATGRLEVARRVSYRLEYAEGRVEGLVPSEPQREYYAGIVRQMVVNPQSAGGFAPAVGRSVVSALPPGRFEYVVISEPPIDTCFGRLVGWKTLKGIPATMVTKTYITANYSGYDYPEKMRNFIKDAYQNWQTRWVLIGGAADHKTANQNIIPGRDAWYMRQGLGYYNDEDTIPTDLYFGGLDGTWDANGNHTYGERADQADMLSEVYVGRASVNNVAQAQNFVNKVITYENAPGANYLRKMLLPTAILWSSYEERPMQESIARMTPAGWSDGRPYERTGNLSLAAVRDSLNAGCGMGHWVGHGDENGIYMGSSAFMNSSTADGLTNGNKLGINVSIACFTGAWDEVPGGDCFAEHLVNRVGGGLVASAMNSRYGYGAYTGGGYVPGPSERLDTVFFSKVLNGSLYRMGEALAFARGYWAPWADSTGRYDMQRFCIYELNLFGDPELSLWTAEPSTVVAAHAGVMTIGSGIPYPVTVTTAGDAPVENALVLLWKGSEVYTTGRTNSSGQVTLTVSAPTPGPMVLSVNARNHYLLVDTVQVIATQRYVAWLRSGVLDPAPGGNNDSILNPGETVELPTWVKNWGSSAANGVTARLVTHDPNAGVSDSVKSFGTIAAGDSAFTGTNGFNLTVSPGVPNGHVVACSLICRDALDSVWVSCIGFTVGAPVLQRGAVTIADAARGNGNGRLDPGEESDIVIDLTNTGLGHGYNCGATLVSGDARLTVSDANAAYGTIRAGQTVGNGADYYVVSAAAGIPLETAIPCTLHVHADGGYQATRVFTITVGEIRTVDPIPDGPRTPARYYAYDNIDTGYEQHPTYNWVEVSGVGTRLNYSQNDAVIAVTLPSGFGPVKFYGQRYTQVSVSADGWIAMGNYTTGNYDNTPIPSSSAPRAAVFANWDDLYPVSGGGGTGNVYWYHDAANGRFIVEYDSVGYYSSTSTRDKFEVIIYDTTVVTPTGDNLIVVQYKTAAGLASSTLGIQDQTMAVGIQSLCDGTYHRGCAAIAPGRAIAYSTDPPGVTGVVEPAAGAGPAPVRLAALPNPAPGGAAINWHVARPGRVSLRLYDAAGREVRNLVDKPMAAGNYAVTWDGRNAAGRPVAAGVYFCQLETEAGASRLKVTLTR